MEEKKAYVDQEPIHGWFELSYSSYLVLPRSILQSMPVRWQRRFVHLLHDLRAALGEDTAKAPSQYDVRVRDERGRFVRDPYSDYNRGRRRVDLPGLGLKGKS